MKCHACGRAATKCQRDLGLPFCDEHYDMYVYDGGAATLLFPLLGCAVIGILWVLL